MPDRFYVVRVKDNLADVYLAEFAGCYDPPPDFEPALEDPLGVMDWDRAGVFYEDEDRPEGCVPLYSLTIEPRKD